MELTGEIILACVIIIVAGVGLVNGNLSAQDFITILGMIFSFLAGFKLGFYRALKQIGGMKK